MLRHLLTILIVFNFFQIYSQDINWLTLDKAKLSGIFDNIPERDQIEEPVEEQLVVELYSK